MSDEEEKQIVQHYHSPKNVWDAVIQPIKTAGSILLLAIFLLALPVCGLVCGDCSGCVDLGEVIHGKTVTTIKIEEGQ